MLIHLVYTCPIEMIDLHRVQALFVVQDRDLEGEQTPVQ